MRTPGALPPPTYASATAGLGKMSRRLSAEEIATPTPHIDFHFLQRRSPPTSSDLHATRPTFSPFARIPGRGRGALKRESARTAHHCLRSTDRRRESSTEFRPSNSHTNRRPCSRAPRSSESEATYCASPRLFLWGGFRAAVAGKQDDAQFFDFGPTIWKFRSELGSRESWRCPCAIF